jgi:aspartyl-tRNA(Asn)/glutamyl-tRNA(Gln) amidotransferase subunit A
MNRVSNSQFSSYRGLREGLESKAITCEDMIREYLARIESAAGLNIFITVFKDQSIARARALDEKLRSGGRIGKLFGLPVALKDNLSVKGERLTCGSKMLGEFSAIYDATAISRLLAEDAILIGKTNMDEFAMGSSNENSAFGAVKNPLNSAYVPGGSSGGSAAAVAADLALVALGSDTGGSVRQPASFCNVIGLKPTYGRVSRYGLVAFGSSFDQIGIFGKDIRDVALVLEVIAGEDSFDSTTSDKAIPSYGDEVMGMDMGRLRIGIPNEFFTEALDKEVGSMVRGCLDQLQSKGAKLVEISLPHSKYALAAYYILATAEASSNLSRYDGARYGYRSKDSKGLNDMYVHSRSEGFGAEVKRRIMLGTYVLSSGYYDAYYKKAQQVRRRIREDYERAFEEVDIIAGPTSPVVPFKFGERTSDPLTMYLADIYTVPMNLAGVPAVSIPIGLNKEKLPVGLQLVSNFFDESRLFQLAHEIKF